MPFLKRIIPVQAINWAASQLKSRSLPLAVMAGLRLRLDADYDTHTSAPTAENFWRNIIKRIEIVLNGQDTLINLPFEFLLHMNTMEQGVAPKTSVDVSTSASNAKAYGNFFLPFELLNSVLPRDTLLDARLLSSCVLNVSWGAASDLLNINTINSATLGIVTKEFGNIPDPLKLARHEYAYDTILLNVAGDITFQLPTRGENQYRRIWILVLDGSTPAVLSDVEITNIKVASRSFVYYDDTADNNLAAQNKSFGRAALTGVYCVDFTTEGQMTTRIDAREMNELTLTLTSQVTDGSAIIIAEKAMYKKING